MVLSSVLSHGEQGMDVSCTKGATLLTLLTGPFPVLLLVWCVEGRTVVSIESNHTSGMQ